MGYYFPKTILTIAMKLKAKIMLDLQDCFFQVGYCHAKQVSVTEQRKDFVVDLEKMGVNLLFV